MINKAIIIGRLGRDPELRRTATGTAVVNFSLATDETWTTREGEKQTRTEWHNIVVWSRMAEICAEYLQKGRLVYIEGRLQTREWEDRDGNKRRTTEIVASEMKMLDGRNDSYPQREPVAVAEGASSGGPGGGHDMDAGITDDDIPF